MKRCKSFIRIISILAIVFLFPAMTVFADFAPKPSIEVRVVNPPEGDYLIDFLIDTPRTEQLPEALDAGDIAESVMRSYNKDGWHARCAGLNGLDYATIHATDNDIYRFTYMVPESFRMIIITADGKTMVSAKLSPILYNTTVTFDAVSGSLNESAAAAGNSFVSGIKAMWPGFGITFGITVVAEGIIMAMFFLKWGWRGWIKFVLTQVLTQVLLYLFLLVCSMLGVLFLLKIPIAEVAIIIIEAAIYDRFIDTAHRGRMTLAAIVANLITGALYYVVPFVSAQLP